MNKRERIARRAARELRDGDVVNLGFGIPTLVTRYVPEGVSVVFQSENGVIHFDSNVEQEGHNPDLINAGGEPIRVLPGGAFFDSFLSFSMIRGGYIDITILGSLEVDQEGNIANWMIPGVRVPGIGGAMDLLAGAKRVVVTMEHTAKDGKPKIVDRCTLPLTARGVVDKIITEHCVIEVGEGGLTLAEVAPDTTVEEVQRLTGVDLLIPPRVGTMEIA